MKVISLQSALLTAMLAIAFVAAGQAATGSRSTAPRGRGGDGSKVEYCKAAMACQAKVIVGISPCRDSPASNPST
jgi:hypothetical protein